MYLIYFVEEVEERVFAIRPYHEDVVLESGVCQVLVCYPWVDVVGFEFAHVGICVRP